MKGYGEHSTKAALHLKKAAMHHRKAKSVISKFKNYADEEPREMKSDGKFGRSKKNAKAARGMYGR